jgi:periplasmic protein TonB
MTAPQDPDAGAPHRGARVHASLPVPDRRSRAATFLSFLIHALIIYLAIRLTADAVLPPHSPIGDAIQMVLGGGGGGGGQSGQAFKHAAVPPAPPPVTPIPPPPPMPTVVPPPPPVQQPVPQTAAPDVPTSASSVPAAGTGTGTGGGTGTGTGTGNGSGQGPGSGAGSGGGSGGGTGGYPPTPKQLILPPIDNPPKELRGKPVEVTYTISETGAVLDVKFSPEITNKKFAKKLDEVMRGYTFSPARDPTGKKVASVFVYTLTLGGQ